MKEIDFDAFYQLYQNDQLSLVDVREVDEFEALHLEGAQNLPLSQLADTFDQLTRTSYIMLFVIWNEIGACLPILIRTRL